MKTNEQKHDVFRLITDVVIKHLESGLVPWKKPWTDKGLPINLVSCKPYGALNLWLLNALDYPDSMFLTANQAHKIGGGIRSDEVPHLAMYWKWPDAKEKKELTEETGKEPGPQLKYYYLFNLAQCMDIPDHHIPMREPRKKFNPIDLCKEVVSSMPNAPEIRHQGERAYYQPVYDLVTMPSPERFANDEYYYSTLFKLLIQSTEHEKRLHRKANQTEVTNDMSLFTELVAEIGAGYLCSYCGIDTWNFENRIEYAQGWIDRFAKNSRLVIYASIQAQKAVEYILSENKSYVETIKIEERVFEMEAYG